MPWTGVQRLCALADHGIFDENNRFTRAAPKKYCRICPRKSRTRLSGLSNWVFWVTNHPFWASIPRIILPLRHNQCIRPNFRLVMGRSGHLTNFLPFLTEYFRLIAAKPRRRVNQRHAELLLSDEAVELCSPCQERQRQALAPRCSKAEAKGLAGIDYLSPWGAVVLFLLGLP